MYTDSKSVQILLALMKSYGIDHLVIAPGTRGMPLVHSVEQDPDFHCYSITDERSAGFFALGLIQELNKPVAVCCTSGTAVTNILSATNEAYFQRLPLLLLTADRPEYLLDQYQDQMVDTQGFYKVVTKRSVFLPRVRSPQDEWRCMLNVNQALSELYNACPGPVNINFPVDEDEVFAFSTKELPKVRRITRHNAESDDTHWRNLADQLNSKARVLVVCGQHPPFSAEERRLIETFVEAFQCVLVTDHLSNLHVKRSVQPSRLLALAAPDTISALVPEIVITFGGHTMSSIGNLLKKAEGSTQHWLIHEGGEFFDTYKKLTTVMACSPLFFFRKMLESRGEPGPAKKSDYYQRWMDLDSKFSVPELGYSDISAVQKLMSRLPKGSLLHLANSLSVRYAQFFPLDETIRVSCNRGCSGIDGSMSTFIGASAQSKRLSVLLIGDLSFFYDMTALWNRHIGGNVRILLNNNACGMIFNSKIFWAPYENVNDFTAAGHDANAEAWSKARGFRYLSARNAEELEKSMAEFLEPESNVPALLEVFTSNKQNNDVMVQYIKGNREMTSKRFVELVMSKIIG